MLLASCRYFLDFFVGRHGYHCPQVCINEMWYWSRSYFLPMRMKLPLHMNNISSSLYGFTSSWVNMEILLLLAVLPTLMSDVGNSTNVSGSTAFLDFYGKGRLVTCFPLLVPLFATPTCFFGACRIGNPNLILSDLLIQ